MDDVDWKALYLQQIELHNLTLDELRIAQQREDFPLSEDNVNKMLNEPTRQEQKVEPPSGGQSKSSFTAIEADTPDAVGHYEQKKEEVYRDKLVELLQEVARLKQVCRDVYEVWAGSEGIPEPVYASEAYVLSLVEQMRDYAKEGLK